MAEPIGSLRAEMSAGHAAFASDMKKARDAVINSGRGMQAAMDKVKGSFENALRAVNRFGGYAATAAIGGFALFIKNAIDTADEMSKMAQAIGVPVESLSTLAYAAKISGVEIASLRTSFSRLGRNMTDAVKGIGEAKEGFAALNINLKNSDGSIKSSEQTLKEIADKFKNLEDGAIKTGLAMQIFGRSGTEMIPMLNQGAAGIEALQAKAKELGLEISTEMGKAAEDFNDQLLELKSNMTGFGRSIATDALPALNDIVETMREAYNESGLLMAAWVALGGIGYHLWGGDMPLQRQIDELKELIETSKAELEKSKSKKFGFFDRNLEQQNKRDIDARAEAIRKLEERLAGLISLQKQEAANQDAKRQRDADEKKAREESTVALEKQLAGQKDLEQELKKANKEFEDGLKKQTELEKFIESDLTKSLKEMSDQRIKTDDAEFAKRIENLNNYHALAIEQLKLEGAANEDLANEIIALYESTRTPVEKYLTTYERLNELYESGAISLEVYIRAIEQARDAVVDLADSGKDQFADLKMAIEGWGRDSAAAIVDFAMTGKDSFSDMIDSMIRDILRMIVYQNITKPIAAGISTAIGGAVAGGRAGGGSVSPGKMYEVNERGTPELLNVGNRQFLLMAQKPGYVAAAAASSAAGNSSGVGGGEIVVNIHNNNASEITQETRETPRGMEIDVMVDAVMAKKISSFGSKSNRALRSNFGASERLVNR